MTFETQRARTTDETLVISRTEEGFRVYAPADPSKSYVVTGSPEHPACTCPDYQCHEGNPFWQCRHISAVLNQLEGKNGARADLPDAEERRAIQEEARAAETGNGTGAQMLLKRSVSPDGKIDSLSVEFSCGVDDLTGGDIKNRAGAMIHLQGEIIRAFLGSNGTTARPPKSEPAAGNGGNGALPAQIVNIGGVNTKWGRRLFLSIQSNGQTLKFFGTRKQLAEALTAAGYGRLAERIDEGVALNIPCRITTKPSEDGRYVNVESVLPAVQYSGRPM